MIKKKILLFTSEFPPLPGGIGNHALHLSLHLQQKGYEVTVLADQRSLDLQDDLNFDQTLAVKVIRIKRKKPALLTYLNRVGVAFKLIQNNEIILASGKFPLWIVALWSAVHRSKKYMAVLHGSELGAGGTLGVKVTNWSLTRFKKLIAVSQFTKNLALKSVPKVDITVINNGFSPNHNAASPVVKYANLSLVTVGNVTYRKGQQNVIKALPLIQQYYPEVSYHIIGLPTEKESFLALAKSVKVEQAVVFHGALSDEALQKTLAASHVFLMLSDQLSNGDVEGFGIAVLEANDRDLPAIGSLNSGIADAIKEGYSGKLVDPHQPTEILKALQIILGDYEQYAVQAKKWSEHFYWETVIEAYIKELGDNNEQPKKTTTFVS